MGVTSAIIQISLVDLVSRGVDGLTHRMQVLSGATKETQKHFDTLLKMGKGAAIAGIATRTIAMELQPAVRLASNLQAEMKGVKAELSGGGKDAATLRKELAQIKSTAFDVQGKTPYNSTQLVAQAKALVKAGADVKDIIGPKGAVAASSALATYEEMDPVKAGEALISIGTPFKVEASGYMQLADDISKASSASIVGAAEIVETAKYAATGMAAMGKGTKEMLAMSAVMAQVGITGSMGGTSLKNFYLEAAKWKVFRDAKGNLLETSKIIDILRTKTAKMGDAQRATVFKKIFGEQGMPVALALLNQGKGSYEEITKAMEQSLGLQEKLNISMEGFGKKLTSLQGTSSSAIADLFQPALDPLGLLVDKANEFAYAIGKGAQNSDTLGKTISGISFGALGVGATATLGMGAGALWYARKALKGVGGFKGLFTAGADLAGNVAAGKALEKAAKVTPVFVVNWPNGGGGLLAGGPPNKPGTILDQWGRPMATGGASGATQAAVKGAAGLGISTMGMIALPLATAAVARPLAKMISEVQARGMSTQDLKDLRSRQMVMGGGPSSYQVKLIDEILAERFMNPNPKGPALVDGMMPAHGQAAKNEVIINLQVDKDGKIFGSTDSKNTTVKTSKGAF